MTNEEAKNILVAKLICLTRETSGTDVECNSHNCENCGLNYDQGNMGEQKEALDMAIKALEQTRWTPVSERLPKANGRYYVTRGLNACGALWNKVYIVNYSDLMGLKSERIWWGGNVGKSDFERFDDVLAWMPLPLPYKEEQDVKNNTDND